MRRPGQWPHPLQPGPGLVQGTQHRQSWNRRGSLSRPGGRGKSGCVGTRWGARFFAIKSASPPPLPAPSYYSSLQQDCWLGRRARRFLRMGEFSSLIPYLEGRHSLRDNSAQKHGVLGCHAYHREVPRLESPALPSSACDLLEPLSSPPRAKRTAHAATGAGWTLKARGPVAHSQGAASRSHYRLKKGKNPARVPKKEIFKKCTDETLGTAGCREERAAGSGGGGEVPLEGEFRRGVGTKPPRGTARGTPLMHGVQTLANTVRVAWSGTQRG